MDFREFKYLLFLILMFLGIPVLIFFLAEQSYNYEREKRYNLYEKSGDFTSICPLKIEVLSVDVKQGQKSEATGNWLIAIGAYDQESSIDLQRIYTFSNSSVIFESEIEEKKFSWEIYGKILCISQYSISEGKKYYKK